MRRFLIIVAAAIYCCACSPSSKPFKFVHLTDTQIGFMDGSEGYAHSDSLFKSAVARVNSETPDLVFITGDLVDNTSDAVQEEIFKTDMGLIEVPVWLVPGNHDYNKAWTPEIRDRYVALRGYDRFSFKHKGCAFIGFDTNCIMEDAPEAEAVQKEWLASQLKKARRCRHVFLFIHCPVFRDSVDEPHDYSNFPVAKRSEYLSLFKEYGVTAVFAGHTHADYDFEYDGIRFIIGNPVANALGHGHPGFNVIDVNKDVIDVRKYGTTCSVSEAYPKADGVTRIVQYNVGVFSKEIENSIPMVASMMKEIGADAVSLNELDSCCTRHENFQLKDFAGEMGGWNYRFGRAMPFQGGSYGVGIAVPGTVQDSFTIPLPKGNGSEPRACCVVETNGYVLATTHLDYKDMPSMVIQAQTLTKALSEKYMDSRKPIILAGDLNATEDSDVLDFLKEQWEVLSCPGDTFNSSNPSKRIDFILALRNRARYEVAGSAVPVSFKFGDVAVASDHLPVYVDLRLF